MGLLFIAAVAIGIGILIGKHLKTTRPSAPKTTRKAAPKKPTNKAAKKTPTKRSK